MRHTGDRVRQRGCESVEKRHQQHAVDRSAYGPRGKLDQAVGPLADVVTKELPQLLRQRCAFFVQKEQQQDSEADDQEVANHKLADRLRPAEQGNWPAALHPDRERSWMCELAAPALGEPSSGE